MRRIPELDGLRGVAILLVIAYHYLESLHRNAEGLRYYLLHPARMGWMGIDLFFVLSGFLIGSILIANRDSPVFFRTFYIRRFCRILPLYLAVVAGCYLVHVYMVRSPAPPLWLYLTFTQNFWMAAHGAFGVDLLAVTWSLAVEEQFYLLLPLIVRFNRPKRMLAVIIGCICLAPFLRYWFVGLGSQEGLFAAHVLLFTHLDALMLGVLMAWMRSQGIAIPRRTVRVVWIACALLLVYTAVKAPAAGAGAYRPAGVAFFYAVVTLFCASTVAIALDGGFRFLRWKALAYTGLISYGLYLMHQPLNWAMHVVLRWHDWTDVRLEAMSLVAVFVIAALSWELFEKRFVRYGHRFGYGNEKGAAFAAPERSTQTGCS